MTAGVMQMPETDPEKALDNLGKRIEAAKPPPAQQPSATGRGMQAGMELSVAVIACTLMGVGLDRWLETKPLFMLLGLVLGFAAGMWSLYRASQGMSDLSVGVKKKSE